MLQVNVVFYFLMTVWLQLWGSDIAKAGPLTPEQLVTRALLSSATGKEIGLQKPFSDAEKLQTYALLDWQIGALYSSSHNQGESPSSFSIDEEKARTASITAQKLFSSGTALSFKLSTLDYEVSYPADLPFPAAKNQANTAEIEIKQDLWRNSLGKAVSSQLAAADIKNRSAEYSVRSAQSEFAANILTLYWQAYALDRSQGEWQKSLKRMDDLLEYTKQRSKFGLLELGELERIKADRQLQVQQRDSAKSQLQRILTQVAILLGLTAPKTSEGILPQDFPLGPRPEQHAADIQETRAWKIASSQLEASVLQAEASQSQAMPELSVFAKIASNGVDAESSAAWEELQNVDRPNVTLGLSFSYALGNRGGTAAVMQSQLAKMKSEFALERVKDDWNIKNKTLLLAAQTAWDRANASMQIKELRAKATKKLTKGYRQGRLGLDQVIMASNFMTQSELTYLNDMAMYFIARDDLLAHREQLLKRYVILSQGGN